MPPVPEEEKIPSGHLTSAQIDAMFGDEADEEVGTKKRSKRGLDDDNYDEYYDGKFPFPEGGSLDHAQIELMPETPAEEGTVGRDDGDETIDDILKREMGEKEMSSDIFMGRAKQRRKGTVKRKSFFLGGIKLN